MASISTLPRLPSSDVRISGELQDALVSAMAIPPDPRGRSAVICTVIHQMRSILECLKDSETLGGCATEPELTSMRELAAAAYDHRLRMTFVGPHVGKESR